MLNDKDTKVAIIMVNWNCFGDTRDCILSLEKMVNCNYHIFVVDNGSTDDSLVRLTETFINHKDVSFLPAGKNLGCPAGNNVGIQEAYRLGYQYYWLLNPDTAVEPDTLAHLMKVITKDRKIGIVGSKIYYYGTNLIWFAGGRVNTFTGQACHIGLKEEDHGQFDVEKEFDYITGCSLLFRRELLESVGGMTEDYFLYFEETDWNIRAKQKGWIVKYVPQSIVHHKVSASSGGERNIAPYVAYYELRNSFVMIRRTQAGYKTISAFFYLLWKVLKKVLKIAIRNQDRKRIRMKYVYLGIKDAIRTRMGKHPTLT